MFGRVKAIILMFFQVRVLTLTAKQEHGPNGQQNVEMQPGGE